MRNVASFFVPGNPVTQGSKIPLKLKDGRTVVVEERRVALKEWRRQIADVARGVVGGQFGYAATGPVALTLQFRMPPPASLPKWRRLPWTRPDATKLARAAEDAMSKVLYKDDGQVACLIVTKVYALDGPPGVRVTIQRLEDVERDARGVIAAGASPAEAAVAMAIAAARTQSSPEPAQPTLLEGAEVV